MATSRSQRATTPPAPTTTNTSIDTTGIVGFYTSITIGTNGNPIISYFDGSVADQKIAACDTHRHQLPSPPPLTNRPSG